MTGKTIGVRTWRFACAVAILLLTAQAVAQETEATTADLLSELLDEFLVGASINDRQTHQDFWAEDLIYTSSSGERFGKAQIMSGLDSAAPTDSDSPRYSAAEVRIQDFGSTAVVTFRLLAHIHDELDGEYLNTGVFRSGTSGWQAVTWQATRASAQESDTERAEGSD